MLNEKYTIPVHSFVDLITNSSTEIYIEADKGTFKSVTEMINKILDLGGSKMKCDDLFTIELGKEEEYSSSVSLIVKSRDENSELGKKTAAILSDLTGLFSIDAAYNG